MRTALFVVTVTLLFAMYARHDWADKKAIAATRWALRKTSSLVPLDWEVLLGWLVNICRPLAVCVAAACINDGIRGSMVMLFAVPISIGELFIGFILLPGAISGAIRDSRKIARSASVESRLQRRKSRAWLAVMWASAITTSSHDFTLALACAAGAVTLYVASVGPSSCVHVAATNRMLVRAPLPEGA